MKLLKPRNRILLALGIIGDIWDESRLLGGLVSQKYRDLYGWVPPAYKRNNFYQTIYRSLTTNDLEKVVVKGEPCFRLTSVSKKKLIRDFPIFRLQANPWRRIWSIGVYDVEEIVRWERNWLRELLLSLGFGRLQRSVYISPYEIGDDLAEMMRAKKLDKKVEFFTQANLAGGHEKELALKVWPVEELSEEYEKIVNDCLNVSELSDKERQEEIQRIRTLYLDLLIKDPHLPFALLPSDWQGEKTRGLVKSLK